MIENNKHMSNRLNKDLEDYFAISDFSFLNKNRINKIYFMLMS